MADSFLTLADLTTINDARLADRDISDLLDRAPLLAALAADTSPDTTHRYLKETAAPAVGFRSVNDGRENAKSADTEITVALKILDASFAADQALADAYRRGREAYIGREAERHLKAAFFKAEEQIIGGTVDGDSSGFEGLADQLDALADAMVVNAGGTGGGSVYSSVYAVKSSLNDVCVIMGNSGDIAMGETVSQRISGSSTGTYPGLYTPISGWMGLQIGGLRSQARICNLDDSSNKLDDDKLASVLELFPAGAGPDYFVMSRQSRRQLQQSRTATNATGAPAPFPVEAFGVPIITSDGVSNTEAEIS